MKESNLYSYDLNFNSLNYESEESFEYDLSDESIKKKLVDIFIESDNGEKFLSNKFFSKWFVEQGEAFFFLFKKNLNVTNIQFAELLALLKCHIKVKAKENNDSCCNLHFLSVSEFENLFNEIAKTFPRDIKLKNTYKHIVEQYFSLLKRTIIVESFYGSCAVYIPFHLKIDLLSICANSGYIHSCGHKIYSSNVYTANKDSFFDELTKYLNKYCANSKPVIFGVLSHEDFPKRDPNVRIELRDGVNEVKVYLEKYYMGSNSLVNILQKIKEEHKFKNRLKVLNPTEIDIEIEKFKNVETSKSIWLIIDKSIERNNIKFPGEDRHFICFERCFNNRNPFHFFDENKPAWIAHTTIPHTLVGAMINITKPLWPKDYEINFGDPFVGTGTTQLEMLKYKKNRNISINCSDIDKFVPILVKDNLEFFAMPSDKLSLFCKELNDLLKDLNEESNDSQVQISNKPFMESFIWASKTALDSSGIKKFKSSFSSENLEDLENHNLFDRILFYLALRTNRRHGPSLKREKEDWITAYDIEANLLIHQIQELIRLKNDENKVKYIQGSICVFQGDRSYSCSIYSDHLAEQCNNIRKVEVCDARKLEANHYNLIITDPPYGFNTKEETLELAELYADVIKYMVKALKSDGQLVICLPNRIHTGKQSLFFTHKELVIRQVLIAAEEQNREVINTIEKLPKPKKIFTGPYYWESKRSLQRSILHFRIRDIHDK